MLLVRRSRLLVVVAFVTGFVFFVTRSGRVQYETLKDMGMPNLKIPDGWRNKDQQGSFGSDSKSPHDKADPAKERKFRWGMDAQQIKAAEAREKAESEQRAKEQAALKAEKAAKKEAKLDGKGFINPSELDPDAYANDEDEDGNNDDIDWSKYAYVQYATDSDYLCNTVMMFEALKRLGAMADRLLMYPSDMLPDPNSKSSKSKDGKLVIKARDEYGAKLAPIKVQQRLNGEDYTWSESYTKLLSFNQTQYERVLHLDADSWVLGAMDELFLLPEAPVAMPRAYWLLHDDPPRRVLSSQVMLVQPSEDEFVRIQKKIDSAAEGEYDMEIVNQLYLDTAMILPHRKYNLLTAEFRSNKHAAYLGSSTEKWDPHRVYSEAKFMHFSDWPVPKPWIPMDDEIRTSMQPACHSSTGKEDCTERKMWNAFYDDYWKAREKTCYGHVEEPEGKEDDESEKKDESEKSEESEESTDEALVDEDQEESVLHT